MADKPVADALRVSIFDQEQEKARYKAKVARRTQEIRDAGDKWLAKLAQMPRDSARFRK